MSEISLVISHTCRMTSEFIATAMKAASNVGSVMVVNDLDELPGCVRDFRPQVALLAGVVGERELRAVRLMREVAPRTGVVLVATEPSRALVGAALKAGNVAVVSHNASMSQLMHCVSGAAIGCATIDADVLEDVDAKLSPLSDRERELLILTNDGSPIKDIAAALFLTPGTVRNISSSAIRKVAARNRFEAARVATARGWL